MRVAVMLAVARDDTSKLHQALLSIQKELVALQATELFTRFFIRHAVADDDNSSIFFVVRSLMSHEFVTQAASSDVDRQQQQVFVRSRLHAVCAYSTRNRSNSANRLASD